MRSRSKRSPATNSNSPLVVGAVDGNGDPAVTPCVESFLNQAFREHSFVNAFGNKPDEYKLKNPRSLTVSAGGQVLVADTGNHTIVILGLSSDKRTLNVLNSFGGKGSGAGKLLYPHALAEIPTRRILVADAGNHRVVVLQLSPNGRNLSYLSSFGTHGSSPGQFDFPFDLTVTAGGAVLVADINNHRVVVLQLRADQTLGYLSSFGSAGRLIKEFEYPYGIVATPSKEGSRATVLVSDMCSDRITILHLSPDGKNLTYHDHSAEFNFPHGLAVLANGVVLVADSERSRIVIIHGKRRTRE